MIVVLMIMTMLVLVLVLVIVLVAVRLPRHGRNIQPSRRGRDVAQPPRPRKRSGPE